MAKKSGGIPKSDQPRYGQSVTKKDSGQPPSLQYRIQGMRGYGKSSSTRNLSRDNRG